MVVVVGGEIFAFELYIQSIWFSAMQNMRSPLGQGARGFAQ